MPDSPGAEAHALTKGAEELGEEFGKVLAEIAAPALGILMGYWGGSAIGGAWMVGNTINNVINPKNDPSYYKVDNAIAGLLMGGIFGLAGGMVWSVGSRHKSGTKPSSILMTAVTRFVAGFLFGMGINYVVQGLTNNAQKGWIEATLGSQVGA